MSLWRRRGIGILGRVGRYGEADGFGGGGSSRRVPGIRAALSGTKRSGNSAGLSMIV